MEPTRRDFFKTVGRYVATAALGDNLLSSRAEGRSAQSKNGVDLITLAQNSLACLEMNGNGRGQELFVLYDNSNLYKTEFAQTIVEEARRYGSSARGIEIDPFLAERTDDEAVAAIAEQLTYETDNPLQRNAINLIGGRGRCKGIRGKISLSSLVERRKAYVLHFPFDEKVTAEAIFSMNPREAEAIALRMKRELDEATHYRIESGQGHVLEWSVSPDLGWVISVGMIKKYSPRGKDGEPIGGWGNPGAEMFTSFAVTPDDHEKINGSFYVDAFASDRVLNPEEAFIVRGVNGAVDIERLRGENPNIAGELLDGLVESFTEDECARYFGELGLGLMPMIELADIVETTPLEKIGGKLHIAPGYDESDRGTGGGFAMSKSHDDWGIREPLFSARVGGKWIPVLEGGTSPYFIDSAV